MAEKRTIELEVKTNVPNLTQQLRAAQKEVAALSEEFGATSKEAVNAAKKAAELKDAIGDAKALTDAFNPDAKFNALSDSIGGVLNGFQAFEGALGFVGVESKDLEETLLKVQSAMALSQGLQGLLEAKDSFVQLGAVAKNALSGIRTGILATGIGLFVVALGTIVAYWDDIKKAVVGNTEEQKKLKKEQEEYNKSVKETSKYVGDEAGAFVGLITQLKQTNAGSKERKNLIKEINSQYGTTLKNISDETAFQKQLNLAVEAYIEFKRQEFKIKKNDELIQRNLAKQEELEIARKKRANEILKERGELTAAVAKQMGGNVQEQLDLLVAIDPEIKRIDEELEKANKRLESYSTNISKAKGISQDTGFLNVTKPVEVVKKEKGELKEIEESFYDDLIDTVKLNEEAYAEAVQEARALNIESALSEQEKEIRAIELKYDKIEELGELNKDLEEARLNELNDIRKKYAKEQEKQVEETNKFIIEAEQNLQNAKFEAASAGLSALTTLAQGNEKLANAIFIIDKALAIAKIVVDTKREIAGYWSNPTWSALPDGGTIIKTSYSKAAKIRAAASIATIAATSIAKFKNGGGGNNSPSGDGGGATPNQVITPNFNIVGQSGANTLGMQTQPLQAYVVSGEVTSQQALDRNRLKNATFG